jgi:hypothetical protein
MKRITRSSLQTIDQGKNHTFFYSNDKRSIRIAHKDYVNDPKNMRIWMIENDYCIIFSKDTFSALRKDDTGIFQCESYGMIDTIDVDRIENVYIENTIVYAIINNEKYSITETFYNRHQQYAQKIIKEDLNKNNMMTNSHVNDNVNSDVNNDVMMNDDNININVNVVINDDVNDNVNTSSHHHDIKRYKKWREGKYGFTTLIYFDDNEMSQDEIEKEVKKFKCYRKSGALDSIVSLDRPFQF